MSVERPNEKLTKKRSTQPEPGIGTVRPAEKPVKAPEPGIHNIPSIEDRRRPKHEERR